MILSNLITIALEHWVALLAVVFVVFFVNNKYYHGLNKYPGPTAAAYTNLWRLLAVRRRDTHEAQYKLYQEYGDIVRLGPNCLMFSDPQATKDIYGLKNGFLKTQLYTVFQATLRGRRIPNMFSTLDEDFHARLRRCVSNAFSMSTLVSYEPLVNSTIDAFLDQTAQRFAYKEGSKEEAPACNFAQWLQYFAFDVIGELAWSKRLGFIDQNEDVDGIIKSVHDFLRYGSVAGQMPWTDWTLLYKNPLKMLLGRLGLQNNSSGAARFALARTQERKDELQKLKTRSPDNVGSEDDAKEQEQADLEHGSDFLARFTRAQAQHPSFMTDARVLAATVSLVFAGSDTTATTLAAIFYFLLRHPAVLSKLRAELVHGEKSGVIPASSTCGTVPYAAAVQLPFLDAVIQESFRMLPGIAMVLERCVPGGGARINGTYVPGGTIVGCNPYVVQRHASVFGADAEEFRPERWLDVSGEKLREMKGAMFQFGGGARSCVGRHISTLEIYKLVPSLLRRFDVELVGETPWKLVNCWVVLVQGFEVRFRERSGGGVE